MTTNGHTYPYTDEIWRAIADYLTGYFDDERDQLYAAGAAAQVDVEGLSVRSYKCQFCGQDSPADEWRHGGQTCPKCGRDYSWLLAQDSEE